MICWLMYTCLIRVCVRACVCVFVCAHVRVCLICVSVIL